NTGEPDETVSPALLDWIFDCPCLVDSHRGEGAVIASGQCGSTWSEEMTPRAAQETGMQAQITALSNRISTLEKDVTSEKALSAERHRQNREDVHNLRGSLQAGFERM